MSVWTSAIRPASRIVAAPSPAARSWTTGASSKSGCVRDDQEDAGGDHRRRVDEGADRRRALHRVREARSGAAAAPTSRPRRRAGRARRGSTTVELRPSARRETESAKSSVPGVLDEQEEGDREGRVAERVHDERLLGRGDRARPLVPEADQQVGREADEAPAGEQDQQVRRLDEQQHREHEQRHVREVAALLVVSVHVPDRVGDDQEADPGDDQHHEDRERVEQDARGRRGSSRRSATPSRSRCASAPRGSRPAAR